MTTDQRLIKGKETKKRIIHSAIKIIANEGSEGISVKKISDSAGISKSLIFHHFENVNDIIENIFKELCSKLTFLDEPFEFDSVEAFLYIIGAQTFNLKGEELIYYKALLSFYNDAVYKDKFKKDVLILKESFIKYLKENIYNIEGIKISDELAHLITIDLDGLGLYYMIEMDNEKYQNLWNLKVKMYIKEIMNL